MAGILSRPQSVKVKIFKIFLRTHTFETGNSLQLGVVNSLFVSPAKSSKLSYVSLAVAYRCNGSYRNNNTLYQSS